MSESLNGKAGRQLRVQRVVGLLVALLKSPIARRRLFWITLRRCPECHGPLVRDWPQYDDGQFIYCMPCGGMMLPPGFFAAVSRHIRTKLKQPNDQAQRPGPRDAWIANPGAPPGSLK